MTWTVHLVEDPETGELIMPIPTDLLNQVGWDFGDTLIWEDMHNGSWSLRKQDSGTSEDATERTGRSNSIIVKKSQST